MVKRARVEGDSRPARKVPNPVPGDDGDALARIAASFEARFPDEWAGLRNVAAECALKDMARLMKGKG